MGRTRSEETIRMLMENTRIITLCNDCKMSDAYLTKHKKYTLLTHFQRGSHFNNVTGVNEYFVSTE